MNKARFLTVTGILGVATALAVIIPLSRVKADHCHPSQSQTPTTDAQEPAGTSASNVQRQRQRTKATVPAPEVGSIRHGLPDSSRGPGGSPDLSLEQIYSRDLPMAILSIGQAVKAIESGDKRTELAELNKAVTMLVKIHAALGKHVKPQFVNSRCPIMGSVINRDTVDESLARDYNGQKIAFCCGGCPSAWDKLTDSQKQAKLRDVKS